MALLFEHLTRSVIGCFYTSYNKMGYGFLENPYVGALVIEIQKAGHHVEREVPITVKYDGVVVGSYRADLVDHQLLVEVKADAAATGVHERQLRNYLRCTDLEVGLLLVYGIKPEYRRFIHTRDKKASPYP